MVAEMRALMKQHDVLVMAGAGPAPRLSPSLAAWPAPNRFQAANLTGNPAIVVPSGFSAAGLPLSLHLIGRSFEDAKLFGFAYAYEQATHWRRKHRIDSVAVSPPVAQTAGAPATSGLDQTLLDACMAAADRAGLRLNDAQLALLCRAAPHVFEMAARVREAARSAGDPAGVFSLK
jgi:aspartyl-tRNA(Asn)/glutamyl-tRNA(Gln) amidotransferase subunit A